MINTILSIIVIVDLIALFIIITFMFIEHKRDVPQDYFLGINCPKCDKEEVYLDTEKIYCKSCNYILTEEDIL